MIAGIDSGARSSPAWLAAPSRLYQFFMRPCQLFSNDRSSWRADELQGGLRPRMYRPAGCTMSRGRFLCARLLCSVRALRSDKASLGSVRGSLVAEFRVGSMTGSPELARKLSVPGAPQISRVAHWRSVVVYTFRNRLEARLAGLIDCITAPLPFYCSFIFAVDSDVVRAFECSDTPRGRKRLQISGALGRMRRCAPETWGRRG